MAEEGVTPSDFVRQVSRLYLSLKSGWEPICRCWPQLREAVRNSEPTLYLRTPRRPSTILDPSFSTPPVVAWQTARSVFWIAVVNSPLHDSAMETWRNWLEEYRPSIEGGELHTDDVLNAIVPIRRWFDNYQGRDGELGFLWGHSLITATEILEGSDLDLIDPDEWSNRPVHFQGADEGDEQIAAGFHAAGSYKGWCKMMQAVAPYPKVKLALYAGLAAPLLPILRAPNFIEDFAGETTSGKTVALRVAASCFGNPDEESANGRAPAMFTWKGTAVWRERVPVVVNHMPFIMDETKHAKHKEDVAETIYMIAQGRGKGRGTIKGTAVQETFSTVMLSSGEQPATSFTQDGGTRARVITVWGSPFGAKDPKAGKLVRRLNAGVKRHYGHAGPRFVQYILQNRKRWKEWRDLYQEYIKVWETYAANNAIAGRLAASFAAIGVTASLVHKAIDLPWEDEDPIVTLWNQLVQDAGDQASKALRYVMTWAYAHVEEFFGRRDRKLGQPTPGWAGRWDQDVTIPGDDDDEGVKGQWKWIGFLPNRLAEILRDGGFEAESMIRVWKDRKWLRLAKDTDGAIRTHIKSRIGKVTARLIMVTHAAVDKAEEE